MNGTNYDMGATDGTGSRSFVTDPYQEVWVGHYTEEWFVGTTHLQAVNPDPDWLPDAPNLPDFDIFFNQPYQCTTAASLVSACTNYNNVHHWILNPVTVYNDNPLFGPSDLSQAISSWNYIQGHIQLSLDTSYRFDVYVDSTPYLPRTTYAVTYFYGADCTTCLYKYLVCAGSASGTCIDTTAINTVDILMNNTSISALANARVSSPTYVGTNILTHEFGHVLGLDDVVVDLAVCSEVKDIMVQGPNLRLGCNILSGNSCDVGPIYSIYPSTMGSCSTQAPAYCSGSCY